MRSIIIAPDDLRNEPLRNLYESAFPEEERIPYDELPRLMGTLPIDIRAYYDGEQFVGFTIVLRRSDFNWFWYFAVVEELRGKGYGEEILRRTINHYSDRSLILDMESPFQQCENSAIRRRRYAFYLRNGFCDTNVGKSFLGIDYTILMYGEANFTLDDYDRIINDLRACWRELPDEE